MREIVPGLREHLDCVATTICHCWQMHRADGIILGFTDHDRNIAFDGLVHVAASGVLPTDIETRGDLSSGVGELAGALAHESITEADIINLKYDDARLLHFAVNWQDPSERSHLGTYIMGGMKRVNGTFHAEIRSIAALAGAGVFRHFTRRCSAELGDGKCGVNLDPQMRDDATLVRWHTPSIVEVQLAALRDEHWFANGRLLVVENGSVSRSCEIVVDRIGQGGRRILELWSSLPDGIAEGAELSLLPGCDKRFSTCQFKFANGINYRGFPHMPTAEFIASYASNSQRMDGSPLVPVTE